MEKWQKIELWLNNILLSLATWLKSFVLWLIPKKIQQLFARLQSRSKNKAQKKKNYFEWFNPIAKFIRIIVFAITDRVSLVAHKISSIKIRKVGIKELVVIIAAFFAPSLYRIKSWWATLRPEMIALTVSGGMLTSLFGLGLISSGTRLAKQSVEREALARELASKIERESIVNSRPTYYKLNERSHNLLNVQIPVYIETTRDIKSLLIDFTFVSSNQYTKNYLLNHEYLVQDRLNTKMQPISSEFLLKDEGKNIIKEKIKTELNELIKELEIKGSVEEVHIHSILAA